MMKSTQRYSGIGFLSAIIAVCLMAVPAGAQNNTSEAGAKSGSSKKVNDQKKERGDAEDKKDTSALAPSGEMIQPQWEDEPLKNVIEDLGILSGTSIRLTDSVDPDKKVSFVSPVPLYWRDVLDRVLEKYDLIARRIGPRQLEVVRPKRVNMEIRNSQFTSIVDTLAKLAGISIIVSPSVAAQNVTIPQLSLNDVPWQAALDTVVKTAGFSTVQEDYGIRRVITKNELRSQLETKTFQLRYLRPSGKYEGEIESTYLDDQASQQEETITEGRFKWGLLNVIDGFLTKAEGGEDPIGSMQYERKRNILVVKDTPQVLRKIDNMLEVLDKEPPQVLLQVRFISTNNTFLRDMGLQYNAQGTSLTGSQFGTAIASSSAEPPGEDDLSRTKFPFGFGGENIDLTSPQAALQDTSVGPFLNDYTLDWTLRFFQQDTSSRVVQSPRLTVVDGHKATVFVGEEIHFGKVTTQTATGSTTVTQSIEEAEFSPVESGFQLLVVPHVVRGTNRVMLSVVPKNNNVTFPQNRIISINQGQTQVRFPTIETSTVVTRMILKSGTTAVLAGLINEDDSATKESVPFLGDVPLLEYLFSARGKQLSDSYDFFFITAHILPSVEEERRRIKQKISDRNRKTRQDYEQQLQEGKNAEQSLEKQLEERRKRNRKEFENLKQTGEK